MTVRAYQGITPTVAESAFIDSSAMVLGDVHIGEDTSIWPLTVIRGDMHRIRIGARTSIQDGSVLHITHASDFNPEGYPLLVGDEVTVGHQVILHGCTLHNKILIGMGSVVLDGAVIEDRVVLGAGSLVPPNKVLKSGFLYLGSPAKQVRPLTNHEIDFFQYSAANYVSLKDQYLSQTGMPDETLESTSKIVDIETQLSFQEDSINSLNKIIYEQHKKIDTLEIYCRQLARKVNLQGEGNISNGDEEASDGTLSNEKPPHY